MKPNKIGAPQQSETYQDDINLYSLINFKDLIGPLFAIDDIKSVIEIGVEVGCFTQWLVQQSTVNDFIYNGVDPHIDAQTKKLFPNLNFINKKSLDYLAQDHCPSHDVYFIDGDHNFYTVYNELQLIFSNSLPGQKICFLHDIGWPCGRRDWYYNINDIPPSARQAYTFNGRISLDETQLAPFGFETCGKAALALHEGGPNNGILTAIEKFMLAHADNHALAFIQLPIFYGLGILYDKNTISQDVAHYLDDLAHYAAQNYILFSQLERNRLKLYLHILVLQQQQAATNNEYEKKLTLLNAEIKQAQNHLSSAVAYKKIVQNSQRNRAFTVLQKRRASYYHYQNNSVITATHSLSLYHWGCSKWRRYRYGHVLHSLKEIVAKTAHINHVSFDFFDTLVHRKISPPGAVKDKTAQYAHLLFARQGITITPQDFNLIRDAEENKLRDHSLYYQKLDHETNINSLFDSVVKAVVGTPDAELVTNLINFELNAEIAHLYLNKDTTETLSLLKEKGKKIIVCSDMYLTEAHLWKICNHFNISHYIDKIYVSSSVGIAKHSGKIFHHIVKDLNLQMTDLVHVGDNEHADYRQPRHQGIAAYHLFYTDHLRQAASLEKRIKQFNNGNGVFTRRCHATLQHFNLDSQQWNYDTILAKIGVCYIAPAVATFAHRALLDILQLGIKKVFFLAREGIFLQKVFSTVLQQVDELNMFAGDISFETLYTSRVASIIGTYNGLNDLHTLIKPVYFVYKQFNVANFFKTWGLSADDFSTQSQQLLAPYMNTCSHEEFYRLIQDKKLSLELDNKMLAQQNIFYGFLRQEGVAGEEAVALVDVGWNGSIQGYITTALKKNNNNSTLYGFYLGTHASINKTKHHCENSVIFPGYLFNDTLFDDRNVFESSIPLLETLLGNEQTASVIGYETSGERIVTTFKSSEKCHFTIKLQQQLQTSIIEGVNHYCAAINTSPLTLSRVAIFYKNRLLSFVSNPKKSELNVFKKLSFDFDWGNNGVVAIVYTPPRRLYFKPRQLLYEALSAAWPHAALKILPIPFLCSFYNLYKRYSMRYPHCALTIKMFLRLVKKVINAPFLKKT